MRGRHFLVGTYTTQRAARGVYLCTLGEAGRIDIADVCESPDPSFIVLHPQLRLAYVVNETPQEHGELSIVSIEGGQLEARQRIGSGGNSPCHLAVLAGARALAVVHYGCGTINIFELDANGALTGARKSWRHQGTTGPSSRQATAHPHHVSVGRAVMYITDLGLDCVVSYTGDSYDEIARCAIHAGAGPRHLCLGESGSIAWLSNELDNTVSRLAVQADGSLVEIDWVSTLPTDYSGRSAVSEIAVHTNGRWLYVGNRGHDSIAWYSIGAGGQLHWCGAESTQGSHPRHFALTPDGKLLLVANRDSHSLVVFLIDQHSGRPVPLATPYTGVPAPVCIRWI